MKKIKEVIIVGLKNNMGLAMAVKKYCEKCKENMGIHNCHKTCEVEGKKDKFLHSKKPYKSISERYPISTFTGETKRELIEFVESYYEKGWNDAVKSKNLTISILMNEKKEIKKQAFFSGYIKGREEGINMFNKLKKLKIALA